MLFSKRDHRILGGVERFAPPLHAGHAIGGNIPGHAQILWLPPTCPFKTPMCAKHKYLAQLKTQPSLIASKAESERCVCERSSHSITSAMILCHNQTTHLTKISKNNLFHKTKEMTSGNKTHYSTSSHHRLIFASHIAASRLAKHLPAQTYLCSRLSNATLPQALSGTKWICRKELMDGRS